MMVQPKHSVAYLDLDHACNRGSLIKLANGELLLGYNQERGRVHADSGQSCPIKSADDGMKWSLDREFVIREGGAADPSVRQYWRIGYPSVTQLDDGVIVAAYHEYTHDARPIQCMWVTRFTL